MKVLFITNHYLDENNGGSNGSKAYLRAISELYEDVTLIYPEHENCSSLKFIPQGVKVFPSFDYRKKWQKGIDVYRGVLHRSIGIIREHLENHYYDIVFLDHSIVANGVIQTIKKQGCKIVTIHHNHESIYILDNKPNILYRWPFIYYVEKAEREAILMSNVNVTVTEKDAQEFRELYPDRNIHCYNMGTYQYKDLPAMIKDDGIRNCKTFAITGSMNFHQSQRPIIEFVERYLPILLRKIHQARLIIAGRDPSVKIQEICTNHPEITLIPNPVNIEDVISEADIYVCPTNMGSGVKLRVMDGLKLGLPILGHSISQNGYESIKRDGYFFDYYDEMSFEHALDDIVRLKYKKQQVYDSFLSYFGFEAGKQRIKEILLKEKLI